MTMELKDALLELNIYLPLNGSTKNEADVYGALDAMLDESEEGAEAYAALGECQQPAIIAARNRHMAENTSNVATVTPAQITEENTMTNTAPITGSNVASLSLTSATIEDTNMTPITINATDLAAAFAADEAATLNAFSLSLIEALGVDIPASLRNRIDFIEGGSPALLDKADFESIGHYNRMKEHLTHPLTVVSLFADREVYQVKYAASFDNLRSDDGYISVIVSKTAAGKWTVQNVYRDMQTGKPVFKYHGVMEDKRVANGLRYMRLQTGQLVVYGSEGIVIRYTDRMVEAGAKLVNYKGATQFHFEGDKLPAEVAAMIDEAKAWAEEYTSAVPLNKFVAAVLIEMDDMHQFQTGLTYEQVAKALNRGANGQSIQNMKRDQQVARQERKVEAAAAPSKPVTAAQFWQSRSQKASRFNGGRSNR